MCCSMYFKCYSIQFLVTDINWAYPGSWSGIGLKNSSNTYFILVIVVCKQLRHSRGMGKYPLGLAMRELNMSGSLVFCQVLCRMQEH